MRDRKVVHTRHVLAVHDLAAEKDHYISKLGFDHDFSAPGWEFLSFGVFKVMMGDCPDALSAIETGDHSYFAHVLVENVDDVHGELRERGAEIIIPIANKPWGLREFSVVTPNGHRLTYGQLLV
jgi:predicted enzyme related to lactoylglutathione lyase